MRQDGQKDKRGLKVKENKGKVKRGERGERRRRERGSSDQGADAILHMYCCSEGLASRLWNTGWCLSTSEGHYLFQIRCLKQLTKPRKEADTKRMDSMSTVQCLRSV